MSDINALPDDDGQAAGDDTPVQKPPITEVIDAWFIDHFHNSIIARTSVEIFNHCQVAKEDLKKRLASL